MFVDVPLPEVNYSVPRYAVQDENENIDRLCTVEYYVPEVSGFLPQVRQLPHSFLSKVRTNIVYERELKSTRSLASCIFQKYENFTFHLACVTHLLCLHSASLPLTFL